MYRYLQEFTVLGTAGGLYHFRDQIRIGNPDAFFVMNGDVCADFPLEELYKFHKEQPAKFDCQALVSFHVLFYKFDLLCLRSHLWVLKPQDNSL